MKINKQFLPYLLVLWGFAFSKLSAQTTSSEERPSFTLQGNLTGFKESTIILIYKSGIDLIFDTAQVLDSKFQFSGILPGPVLSQFISPKNTFFHEQYLENSAMKIDRDSKGIIRFEGSQVNDGNEAFKKLIGPSMELYFGLLSEVESLQKGVADTAVLYTKQKELQKAHEQYIKISVSYIEKRPKSFASLLQLNSLIDDLPLSQSKHLFSKLDQTLLKLPEAIGIERRLASKATTFVNKTAKGFSQTSADRINITLEAYRGKYLLIDFWASWCGPCRAENPFLLKIYNQFHYQGFEILAVSLDENEQKWKEAIKKDNLPWMHVSDLKGWKNEVANQYHIYSIPANFLIDPDGIIIGVNLHRDALEKKLSEIFDLSR